MTPPTHFPSTALVATERRASASTGDHEHSDQASQSDINFLEAQAQALAAHALELERKIEQFKREQHGQTPAEIEKIAIDAHAMRDMASNISNELKQAPTDKKTGKRQISASRVAKLSHEVGESIHACDQEKSIVQKEHNESKKSGATRYSAPIMLASTVAAPAVFAKISRVTAASTHAHLPADSSSGSSIVGRASATVRSWWNGASNDFSALVGNATATVKGWYRSTGDYLEETAVSLVHSAPVETARQWVRDTKKSIAVASQAVSSEFDLFKKAPTEYVSQKTDALKAAVASAMPAPVKQAAKSAVSAITRAHTAVVSTAADGIEWVAETTGRAKASVHTAMNSIKEMWDKLGGSATASAKAQPVAKQKPVTGGSMATALAQAAGISLPISDVLHQSTGSLMGLSSQALSGISSGLGYYVGLH